MLSLTEQIIHSTVRIECTNDAGEQSSGSGFFFSFFEHNGSYTPAIVTNKHVVINSRKGKFHLTLKNSDGMPIYGSHISFEIENFENSWIGHPDNNVDLAIFLIGPVLNKCQQDGRPVFYVPLAKTLIPTQEILSSLTAMEDIIMVGYPNGIWDSVNNTPIIRRGITATPIFIDYEGKQEFMIDAACFPGSSGSPVLLLNQGSYPNKEGSLVVGTRVYLLGVLYAGPQHTATGTIIVANIPTDMRPIPISRIPNNLGICIKSNRIMEFERVLANAGISPPEGYQF